MKPIFFKRIYPNGDIKYYIIEPVPNKKSTISRDSYCNGVFLGGGWYTPMYCSRIEPEELPLECQARWLKNIESTPQQRLENIFNFLSYGAYFIS